MELCKAHLSSPVSPQPTTIVSSIAEVPQPAQQVVHPVNLPANVVDLNSFPKRYSLNKKMRGQPGIHKDVTELVEHLRAPVETTRDA